MGIWNSTGTMNEVARSLSGATAHAICMPHASSVHLHPMMPLESIDADTRAMP